MTCSHGGALLWRATLTHPPQRPHSPPCPIPFRSFMCACPWPLLACRVPTQHAQHSTLLVCNPPDRPLPSTLPRASNCLSLHTQPFKAQEENHTAHKCAFVPMCTLYEQRTQGQEAWRLAQGFQITSKTELKSSDSQSEALSTRMNWGV